jgi:hypothetical protein
MGRGGGSDLRIASPLQFNIQPHAIIFRSGAAMSDPNDHRGDCAQGDSRKLQRGQIGRAILVKDWLQGLHDHSLCGGGDRGP